MVADAIIALTKTSNTTSVPKLNRGWRESYKWLGSNKIKDELSWGINGEGLVKLVNYEFELVKTRSLRAGTIIVRFNEMSGRDRRARRGGREMASVHRSMNFA
jgi:hypothetical protein